MRLSAVIPTLDAAEHLPACLAALDDADEIIVVDGGSSDATAAIARSSGALVIEGPRGRGSQLAAGAKATTGNWLLFVHADTTLSPGWRAEVERHAAASERPACFRLRLDDRAWQARAVERAVAWRTRLLGLPYGDQALLVSRRAYDSAGGFRPIVLMEDVDLLQRLPRPAVLNAAARTSSERWRRNGWARRSLRNLACLSLWKLGASPERVARLYR